MTIITREKVRQAVERAMLLAPGSVEEAKRAAAQALCLPVEAVHDALQPPGHCCPAGENLGVPVCEECGELWGAVPC